MNTDFRPPTPAIMPKRRPEPAPQEDTPFRLSSHAVRQANEKGFPHADVLAAANDPNTTYANGRYPGQMRHIRGGIVAVVDPDKRHVVTVYENVKETALRADQTDADSQRYGRRQGR